MMIDFTKPDKEKKLTVISRLRRLFRKPVKINGANMKLYVGADPVGLITGTPVPRELIDVNGDVLDITTKDSGRWEEHIAQLHETNLKIEQLKRHKS